MYIIIMVKLGYISQICPTDGFLVWQIFCCSIFSLAILIFCFIILRVIFGKKYSTEMLLFIFYWVGTGVSLMVLCYEINFKLSFAKVQPCFVLLAISIFMNSVFITFKVFGTFFTEPVFQKSSYPNLTHPNLIKLKLFWIHTYSTRKEEKKWLKLLEIPILLLVTVYNCLECFFLSKFYLLWAVLYFFIFKVCWLKLYFFSYQFYWVPLFLIFFPLYLLRLVFSLDPVKTHFKEIYGEDILNQVGADQLDPIFFSYVTFCIQTLGLVQLWWVSICIVDFFISAHLNQLECNILWNQWVVSNSDHLTALVNNNDLLNVIKENDHLRKCLSESLPKPDCSEIFKNRLIFRILDHFS